MNSLGRGIVFFLIGLPIGFILTALAFVTTGRGIDAQAMAPWALGIAALVGIVMGLRGPTG